MNILITGANGYVGKSLTSHLSKTHTVTSVSRKDFDLSNSFETLHWFGSRYFDVVIHAAISGGHRLKRDGADVLDNNLRMYYNLLDNRISYGRFINLGSGAELLHKESMYGLSKHIIRTSLQEQDEFYNIRMYGLFDENELPTRFIKMNVQNYIDKQPMTMLQNRHMDFFYMQDFCKVIDHYLYSSTVPKEYDCCYASTPSLSDITSFINTLDAHQVDTVVTIPSLDAHYSADYPRTLFPLNFVGLTAGISNVYNTLLCKK